GGAYVERGIQRQVRDAPPTLRGLPGLGVVDQRVPHRKRRGPEEVGFVVPAPRAPELQVGLVDEGGGVQRPARADPSTLPARQALQVRIEDRQQLVGKTAHGGRETLVPRARRSGACLVDGISHTAILAPAYKSICSSSFNTRKPLASIAFSAG